MLEDVLLCKTMLTLNAMAVKAVNTHLCTGAHGILAHGHINTPLTTTGTKALFVANCVKLHLTASKKVSSIFHEFYSQYYA